MTSLAWLTASNAFIDGPPLGRDPTIRPVIRARGLLDRELHAFARHDDLDARGLLVRLCLRFDCDPIERIVAPLGVMVIEHESLHLRLHRDLDRARDR